MQIDEDLLRKEVNVVVNGLNKENVTGIFLDKSENIVGIDGYSNKDNHTELYQGQDVSSITSDVSTENYGRSIPEIHQKYGILPSETIRCTEV